MHLERVSLPGVGDAIRFPIAAGPWIGVIRHHDGHRDLVVYAVHDRDTVQFTLRLTEQEAHELAEVLYSHHDAAKDG